MSLRKTNKIKGKEMKIKYIAPAALALGLACQPALAESILGGLEELGEGLNEANSYILNGFHSPSTFAEQMRRYRQLEYERTLELSAVSGVSPEVIRQMRRNGATWSQIAEKYDINLATLPSPVLPRGF